MFSLIHASLDCSEIHSRFGYESTYPCSTLAQTHFRAMGKSVLFIIHTNQTYDVYIDLADLRVLTVHYDGDSMRENNGSLGIIAEVVTDIGATVRHWVAIIIQGSDGQLRNNNSVFGPTTALI